MLSDMAADEAKDNLPDMIVCIKGDEAPVAHEGKGNEGMARALPCKPHWLHLSR